MRPERRRDDQRRQRYGVAIGVVMGMLIAGLAFPLLFGATSGVAPGDISSAPERRSDGLVADAGGARASEGSDTSTSSTAGSPEGPGGSTSGQRSLPPGTALTASDRGVTAETIKVGLAISNAAVGAELGLDFSALDPEREKRAYKAFIDRVNRAGGILGRKIKPVVRVIDIFNEEDIDAACREFVQDHKVFAVFNLFGAGELCYTKVGRVPLIRGFPSWKETIDASEGYLSTTAMSSRRMNQNLAWELHRMGAIKGKKIGLVAGTGSPIDTTRADADAMVKILKDLGHNVAHVSYMSSDFQTGQSQVPGEVFEMKSKGVQVVGLLGAGTNTTFVQTAEAQQFYPRYAVNDWEGMSLDWGAQGMPPSYDNAIAITSIRAGEWRTTQAEPAADRACVDVYEKSSGDDVPLSDDDARFQVGFICEMVQRFADGASRAGAELTRDRLMEGIQQLGARAMAFTGGGSFRRGKFDGADAIRTKRFDYDCFCYVVVDGFRPSRY